MAMSEMVRARFASMRRKRDRATDGCPGADSLPSAGVSRGREPPSFLDRTWRPVYDLLPRVDLGHWDCNSGPALITSYDGTPTAYGQVVRGHFLSR